MYVRTIITEFQDLHFPFFDISPCLTCTGPTKDLLQPRVFSTSLGTDSLTFAKMPLLDQHDAVVDTCNGSRIVRRTIALLRGAASSGSDGTRHTPNTNLAKEYRLLPTSTWGWDERRSKERGALVSSQ